MEFVNDGSKEASFELVKGPKDLDVKGYIIVEPLQGKLGPRGSDTSCLTVKVTLSAVEMGVLRSSYELLIYGKVLSSTFAFKLVTCTLA